MLQLRRIAPELFWAKDPIASFAVGEKNFEPACGCCKHPEQNPGGESEGDLVVEQPGDVESLKNLFVTFLGLRSKVA